MDYGAKGLKWAPFAAEDAEPAGALPNYGASIDLGELIAVSDSPQFAEATASGDNAVNRTINRFTRNNVSAEVSEFSAEAAAAIFGAGIAADTRTGPAKNLHFNDADNPPYGGMAFYVTSREKGDVDKHYGVFYPKLKAVVQGKTYSTTGESITLNSDKANFTGLRCNSGDWKIVSELFDTEEEAADWRDQMLAGT